MALGWRMSNSGKGSSSSGGGGSWWSRMSRSEQVFAAVAAAVIAGIFAIAVAFIDRSSSSSSGASPNAKVTATATSSLPMSAPTSVPLTFDRPANSQSEGKVVSVTLSGTVPRDEHLWIFVHQAGNYYVQGTPGVQAPGIWSLSTVNLGSSLKGDVNSWYTIYAVLANPQANNLIQKEYNSEYDEYLWHACDTTEGAELRQLLILTSTEPTRVPCGSAGRKGSACSPRMPRSSRPGDTLRSANYVAE